ncbi:hypothetical protein C8F04DRAFT_1013071 [Mycena alexandri]|uniref:NADH:flavin oxidoreductase/NADH oxidase N-terminal domain-containing protein n=1 Tax=Mycena alexandri TaxID=1745969 RepID=A0AAD6S7K9_9AGAR|nr:hypothetical protein C8F04DRAFT_1013071 [Mycena alexandri]
MANEGDPIFSPISLPASGRKVRNRLVKVSLYEHLATLFGGPPNGYHFQLYSKWSAYDWGMIFTGNIQVSPQHLCLARDLVLPNGLPEQSLRTFRELASAMHGEREQQPLAIMQLSHAGRQSPIILGGRFPFTPPLGPSTIRLGSSLKHKGILSDLLHRIMFQIPRSMSLADIDDVVNGFVRGARLAAQTGYDGVELHAAHGYLLAQFMSLKSNQRTDEYSCTPSNALRLLHRIVLDIRAAVPSDFILGLKLNAADYTDSGEVTRALDHVRTIAEWKMVDFIEISGGDYEKPDFLTHSASPSVRQTLFAEFSLQALGAVESIPQGPLILLTGGLTTPAQLHGELTSGHAHLLGLGRSAVLCPDLPARLKQERTADPRMPFSQQPDLRVGDDAWHWILARLPRINLLGAGVAMAWYVVALRRLTTPGSLLRRPDYTVRGMGGIVWMWAWFGPEVSRFHTGATGWRFSLVSGFVVVAAAVLVWASNVMC